MRRVTDRQKELLVELYDCMGLYDANIKGGARKVLAQIKRRGMVEGVGSPANPLYRITDAGRLPIVGHIAAMTMSDPCALRRDLEAR